MSIIVFLSVVLLITLLATYLVIENNKKKAELLKKKQYNDRLADLHKQLKDQTVILKDGRFMRPMDVNSIQQLASNFFVVQAKNDDNLNELERLIRLLVNTFQSEINKTFIGQDKELFKAQLKEFIAAIPSSGREFNSDFYQQLPSLISRLETAEIVITESIEQDDTIEHSQA